MSQYQPQQGWNNASAEIMQGQKHAQMSLVFGIIGLFFAGIVFGPLAIVQANKAERMLQAASAGKVLGWISTIFGILGVIGFVLFFGSILALAGMSAGTS